MQPSDFTSDFSAKTMKEIMDMLLRGNTTSGIPIPVPFGVPPNQQPVDMITCGKCKKLWYGNNMRKVLDEHGGFLQYGCVNCITEGGVLE